MWPANYTQQMETTNEKTPNRPHLATLDVLFLPSCIAPASPTHPEKILTIHCDFLCLPMTFIRPEEVFPCECYQKLNQVHLALIHLCLVNTEQLTAQPLLCAATYHMFNRMISGGKKEHTCSVKSFPVHVKIKKFVNIYCTPWIPSYHVESSG